TITFTLTAPNGGTAYTQVVTVTGPGTYTTSNANVATQVGTYTWHATYSGDALNSAALDQGGAQEQVTTVKASPAISTQGGETAGGVVGTSLLSDTATLTAGHVPSATITFTPTAPNGSTNAVGTVTVTGAGTYSSPTVLATQVGTYTWHATYNGDALNKG